MTDKKSILLIEMNETFRDQIAGYIRGRNLECVVAKDFAEAGVLVTQRKFAGIFVDLHSDSERSDNKGIEFVAKTRESNGPNRDTHMVIMCETETEDVSGAMHEEIFAADIPRILKQKPRVRIGGVLTALEVMRAIPPRAARLG